jgi:hypothetical protein
VLTVVVEQASEVGGEICAPLVLYLAVEGILVSRPFLGKSGVEVAVEDGVGVSAEQRFPFFLFFGGLPLLLLLLRRLSSSSPESTSIEVIGSSTS